MWKVKGASLSDKNARKEYGLSQEEIIEAIQKGQLQYRINYIHGNPYYKLLRPEIEALVIQKQGTDFLENKKVETKLAAVTTEIRSLKRKLKALEKEKQQLEQQINQELIKKY